MFKFKLGQQVSIKSSGEKGAVEACAKYIASGNHYYIHYRAADGRAVTKWFEEHHIEFATQIQRKAPIPLLRSVHKSNH